MVATLLGLPSALQAIGLIVKKLSHLDVADRMMPPPQLPRQDTRALADPARRRLGISACAGLDQAIQRCQQTGVLDCEALPSRASLPNASRLQPGLASDLPDPLRNRLPRQPPEAPRRALPGGKEPAPPPEKGGQAAPKLLPQHTEGCGPQPPPP